MLGYLEGVATGALWIFRESRVPDLRVLSCKALGLGVQRMRDQGLLVRGEGLAFRGCGFRG